MTKNRLFFLFVGGSDRFAQLLARVITDHGGAVIAGDGVERIDVEERRVTGVHTRGGKTYVADRYISAIRRLPPLTAKS